MVFRRHEIFYRAQLKGQKMELFGNQLAPGWLEILVLAIVAGNVTLLGLIWRAYAVTSTPTSKVQAVTSLLTAAIGESLFGLALMVLWGSPTIAYIFLPVSVVSSIGLLLFLERTANVPHYAVPAGLRKLQVRLYQEGG